MALLPPIQVHCGKDTYELSRLTQELQDQFGKLAEKRAWIILQDTRRRCTAEDYKILLIEHQRMKREFEFELQYGSTSWRYLDQPEGLYNFLLLALKPYQAITLPQVKQLYCDYTEEFKAALVEMFGQKKTTTSTDESAGDSPT